MRTAIRHKPALLDVPCRLLAGAAILWMSFIQCAGATPASGQASIRDSVAGANPSSASCSAESGGLRLEAKVIRNAGISPFLAFFDATDSSDSSLKSNLSAFQEISYTWSFGDHDPPTAPHWNYGANPGLNSRDSANGGVAAHLYVTQGVDSSYQVTVTARRGTNRASCQLRVMAYDPSGPRGFPLKKTTCVAATTAPIAGSNGCPVGAATLATSNFNRALDARHFGSGKRVLFKCGDAFSGDGALLGGQRWSVGAYGGCEGTKANRPVLSDSSSNGELGIALEAGDGRIADLDLEGNGHGRSGIATTFIAGNPDAVPYQITLSNLLSNGNDVSYVTSQAAQFGLIDSEMKGMKSIGVFINFGGNNPATWSGAIPNDDYQALIGNHLDGVGAPNGPGIETVRIAACRFCSIENNSITNANDVGAVLKLHNGNPGSKPAWSGVYTEWIEISDNLFTGTSGANLVESAPQNGGTDERLRNLVFEKNLFSGGNGVGRDLLVSAVNETVRSNVFYTAAGQSKPAFYAVQVARRGIEPVASNVAVNDNLCFALSSTTPQACVAFDGVAFAGPGINSYAKNNRFFVPGNPRAEVVDRGTGNYVESGTSLQPAAASFEGPIGDFPTLSDFKLKQTSPSGN